MRLVWIPVILLSPWNAFVAAGPARRDQPWPSSINILDFVDDPAVYNAGGNDKCSSTITTDGSESYLAFPNARIIHQSSGTIDCQTQLRLVASQTGYRFSINWVSLSGYLQLEPGAYIERANVSLEYFPGGKQTDVASARNLYGKHGTGYDGYFNVSIPVTPGSSDGKLGMTACRSSAADPRTGISVSVFLSLAHEMIEFDDTAPHYGTVGGESPDSQLKVGFDGAWEKC